MLGIVGGMGPLASGEFLKTIYECNCGAREQDAPGCVVYSDPSFPDRTEAILSGQHWPVIERLSNALHALQMMGAQRFVIACVTAHHFLPWVERNLSEKVISLVDLVIEELVAQKQPYLMICSSGTRAARIFESHPLWHLARPNVVVPSESDQDAIHRLIYNEIKANCCDEHTIGAIDSIRRSYGCEGIIAGCTELHLVTKHLQKSEVPNTFRTLDPLMLFARNLRRLSVESTDVAWWDRGAAAAH